jgi:protein-S-isoprenylcysteine O-methyltransferase Ste14
MAETTYEVATIVAGGGALLRVGTLVVGLVRSIRSRKRFVTLRMGLAEAAVVPESPLLGVVAVLLLLGRTGDPTTVESVAAVGGALIVLAGLDMIAWTLRSWRDLFVGHGVLEGQELVIGGAFGFVRHPVYLGALLVWAGLSVASLSIPTGVVTALYVLPAYVLYIRSEEKMMAGAFGDAYEQYRRSVPMLVPRMRARRHRLRTA